MVFPAFPQFPAADKAGRALDFGVFWPEPDDKPF